MDGDGSTDELWSGDLGIIGNPRRRIVSKLRAQSKCPITQQIVPTLRGLLLEGSADVGLLLFLSRIVGDPEELNGVGLSGGSRQAPHCYSKLGIRFRSPAK